VLTQAERARRAGHARKAYFAHLRCGRHRRGARRPPSETRTAARAGRTRTNRSKRARPHRLLPAVPSARTGRLTRRDRPPGAEGPLPPPSPAWQLATRSSVLPHQARIS
jgi:hypothetical protein